MSETRGDREYRPSPDALLAAARREERRTGRLRIFIGAAPGVGKTYEMLQAARQQAVNFTTLDYRHLDRDLGRVLDGATGEFRKEFEAGTKDLKELVTANRAVSEGEALEAVGVARRVVEIDASLARLGRVHGDVGALHELAGVDAVRR